MIEIIMGLPDHVAAFKATGEVTRDHYEKILIPATDRIAATHSKINFLMVIQTGLDHFTLGAWTSDVKVDLKHFNKWNRIAIVSDEKGIEKLSGILNTFLPGKSKRFSLDQLEEAKQWVSETIEASNKQTTG